jgi:biopolymer transport protein ExbB
MQQLQGIYDQLPVLWDQAIGIWASGGWAMYAIAVNALVMFGMGMHIWLGLKAKGFRKVSESTWREWIDHPDQRRGPIGQLLDQASGARSLKDSATNFQEIDAAEVAPFRRDLLVMRITVGAAPLLGLLGTVTGMRATFAAMTLGTGGEQTIDQIAKGISEALVTTETGLVIGLPGLFFQHLLSRSVEKYEAFLAHVETVFNQKLHWRSKTGRTLSSAGQPA